VEKRKFPDEEIEQMLAEVRATQAIEGFYVTDEETELIRKYARGELTREQVFLKFSEMA
jgi:hypothetical protein